MKGLRRARRVQGGGGEGQIMGSACCEVSRGLGEEIIGKVTESCPASRRNLNTPLLLLLLGT